MSQIVAGELVDALGFVARAGAAVLENGSRTVAFLPQRCVDGENRRRF
jgi:hypothetical protein